MRVNLFRELACAADARVEVRGLTKHYGGVAAVDDVSFTVEPGSVTGFLGPNGAGKTTTLRMILGLVRPDRGRATIGGAGYADLARPLEIVGAALDSTGFHPGRTGLDHLRIYAAAAALPSSRAATVLGVVGLGDAGNRKVGGYSLGMRQRLALATALLGDPAVLILDEPANGLDPEGIVWLRRFLKEYAEAGRSVLVSSHVLTEMQQLVDRVVILHRGRLIREATLAELSGDHGDLETAFFELTTNQEIRP
ncbi:ATP-binding cassette domain-containing protein [Nocardioides sp. KC13]|uniref:ATP-binding cassette domain-containing protein n=1 Tax=Nocardioides turkmenicus TaxID=2711220 RepID=A0A6M1R6T9_9ACTN|nr:ATP-binding cassette domain-containing protein [Nocardioides sp. KC13]NGN95846.1 ATP-binding cassette domain-containing protein [Nocardioides sp. KC13]